MASGGVRRLCARVAVGIEQTLRQHFFCLVDGPRSRLLRPWSRVPGARCGHVALSLNCKDLVPNGEAERQTSQSRQAASLANFELELVEL